MKNILIFSLRKILICPKRFFLIGCVYRYVHLEGLTGYFSVLSIKSFIESTVKLVNIALKFSRSSKYIGTSISIFSDIISVSFLDSYKYAQKFLPFSSSSQILVISKIALYINRIVNSLHFLHLYIFFQKNPVVQLF